MPLAGWITSCVKDIAFLLAGWFLSCETTPMGKFLHLQEDIIIRAYGGKYEDYSLLGYTTM
jgi:hypothetical protein